MISNKAIAEQFSLVADLMRLHGDEDYRVKSYDFAYRNLRNAEGELGLMTLSQLKEIKGIGDAIGQKILEIQKEGVFKLLKSYQERTPKGVQEILSIKGLGPGKVRTLWQDLGLESPGDLLYACNENRLVNLKGFGEKTQEQVRQQVSYFLNSQGQYRWHQLESIAEDLMEDLESAFGTQVVITGDFRRKMPVISRLEFLVETNDPNMLEKTPDSFELLSKEGNVVFFKHENLNVTIIPCHADFRGLAMLKTTGNKEFVDAILEGKMESDFKGLTEEGIFEKIGVPYTIPEFRESQKNFFMAKAGQLPAFVEREDIKGLLHLHTTYSDGSASLGKMADTAIEQGFAYMGVTDHSKAAFYANGLSEIRVAEQHLEIDELNKKYDNFKIYKGIECDILPDGRLDYDDAFLGCFDFVIASVHSQLKMNEQKATDRVLCAIKHPATNILGHPTGRLLLSREGYPLNYKLIIDACAEYGVAIELNSNPLRLDIDWTWIPYAISKGVKIAINPDAHRPEGIADVRFGIYTAQKGGLSVKDCLNSLSALEFEEWLSKKKR